VSEDVWGVVQARADALGLSTAAEISAASGVPMADVLAAMGGQAVSNELAQWAQAEMNSIEILKRMGA
jgi:hypothetical protein